MAENFPEMTDEEEADLARILRQIEAEGEFVPVEELDGPVPPSP